MEGVVLYVALVRVFIKKHKLYMIGFTVASYGTCLCVTLCVCECVCVCVCVTLCVCVCECV